MKLINETKLFAGLLLSLMMAALPFVGQAQNSQKQPNIIWTSG